MNEIEWERIFFSRKRILEAKNQRIGYWENSSISKKDLSAEFLGRSLTIRNKGTFVRSQTELIDDKTGEVIASAKYVRGFRPTTKILTNGKSYNWQYKSIFSMKWTLSDNDGNQLIKGKSNTLKGIIEIHNAKAPEIILSLILSEYYRDNNSTVAFALAVPQVLFFISRMM